MSFQSYVEQMSKKYKLGLAIAVIRNKPENLSTDQYIEQLKEKINVQTETIDENIDFADEFTIHDDDFNFDQQENLSIDYNFNNTTKDPLFDKNHDNIEKLKSIEKPVDRDIHKTTNKDLQQDLNTPIEEATISKRNVIDLNDANADETNSLDEVLRTLRYIDENEACFDPNLFSPAQNNSKVIPPITLNNLNIEDIAETMSIYDDYLDNDIRIASKNNTQENTDENLIVREDKNVNASLKSKKSKPNVTNDKNKLENEQNIVENFIFKNTYDMEVDMALNEIREPVEKQDHPNKSVFFKENANIPSNNVIKELNKHNTWAKNNKINNLSSIDLKKDTTMNDTLNTSTQDTIVYTLHDFTQNTHISQSQQHDNIVIPRHFIRGSKSSSTSNGNNSKEDITANKINKDVINENLSKDPNENLDLSQTPEILTIQSNDIGYIVDKSGKTYAVLGKLPLENVSTKDTITIDNNKHTNTYLKRDNTIDSQNLDERNNTQEKDKEYVESLDIIEDTDANFEEIVPFKVVKELSRIKAYLNKRERRGSSDGCSSDSGYRSDSQNSFKTARVFDEWVDQSAHCLYEYMVRYPLVTATQDIVNDISQVLGRLIDRLHEDEKYPPFLEQLLDKVEELLSEIGQESGCSENYLLDKDETIQRLLLLNKSLHILKFSVEKVVILLENMHKNLTTKDSLYELSNTTEIENLSYIFYVLEFFIQMYGKMKKSSQSQTSQETKILKKSSITEIWKRKWNPNFKEVKNVGSQEKSCVLTKCGEILNKLVVDCMEGYSLVSFAALQCFNLLQN